MFTDEVFYWFSTKISDLAIQYPLVLLTFDQIHNLSLTNDVNSSQNPFCQPDIQNVLSVLQTVSSFSFVLSEADVLPTETCSRSDAVISWQMNGSSLRFMALTVGGMAEDEGITS